MAGRKTFKGGIHPPERKIPMVGKLIHRIADPGEVVIPVNQHAGAPNQPVVQVGDTVKRGQKIADAATPGTLATPVHASISGVVRKIEPRALSNNADGLCIVIEADHSGATDFMPPLDPFTCTKDEALARLRESGIVGMGGAGFPTYAKLSPPPTKPISLVIANGAECEPYLTIDESTMVECADRIVTGLAIEMAILGVKKGIVAVEDNKERPIEALKAAVESNRRDLDISLEIVKTKYPQGGEKMLIKSLTGKEVPSGGLPMDVGCVVSNIGTLKAVTDAFLEGKPLIERGLTISGDAVANPGDFLVPVGTVVSSLIGEPIDLAEDTVRKVIFGGPMMGTAVSRTDIPIQKNTSGVVFMTGHEAKAYDEGPCIRCGRCFRACPCRLPPMLMSVEIKAGSLEEAAKLGLMDCIECGACSWSCPARIKLAQRFRVGKQLLRTKRAAAAATK